MKINLTKMDELCNYLDEIVPLICCAEGEDGSNKIEIKNDIFNMLIDNKWYLEDQLCVISVREYEKPYSAIDEKDKISTKSTRDGKPHVLKSIILYEDRIDQGVKEIKDFIINYCKDTVEMMNAFCDNMEVSISLYYEAYDGNIFDLSDTSEIEYSDDAAKGENKSFEDKFEELYGKLKGLNDVSSYNFNRNWYIDPMEAIKHFSYNEGQIDFDEVRRYIKEEKFNKDLIVEIRAVKSVGQIVLYKEYLDMSIFVYVNNHNKYRIECVNNRVCDHNLIEPEPEKWVFTELSNLNEISAMRNLETICAYVNYLFRVASDSTDMRYVVFSDIS